jgi:hypothetical protein
MNATISRNEQKAAPAGPGRARTVLRVSQGDRYVGDILLDGRDRVWRRADTIPPDVVLKALLAFARHSDICGELVGRLDGRPYRWFVVGALLEMCEAGTGPGEAIEAA